MNKLYLLLCIVFVSSASLAQTTEIWGSLSYSNNRGIGSIFKIDSASKNHTIVKTFDYNGSDARRMMKASDGNYYGIRPYGGKNNQGVIFRLNPNTQVVDEIYHFSLSGMYVDLTSDLFEARPGELWGMAANTGVNGDGIVFKYNFQTGVYSIEFNINSIGTDYPNGGFVKAPNGKLYGLARGIKNFRRGSIFEIDLTTNTIRRRFRFLSTASYGWYPNGEMVLAPNGRLYGTCSVAGGGQGTLFEYNYQTNTVLKRATFSNTNSLGGFPITYLMLANNGKIYGTTSNGGANGEGTIFEHTPGTYTTVKKVDLDTNLKHVVLNVDDGNGRILGFSNTDGSVQHEVSDIVEFKPSTNQLRSLYSYHAFGYEIAGQVYKDTTNLYFQIGAVVGSFDSTFNKLNFIERGGGTKDGGRIRAPMVLGNDQKLYGYSDANDKEPGFFRLDPVNYEYEYFKRFLPGDSIWNIEGNLLKHPNGNFYVAFSLNANTSNNSATYNNRAGILEINPTNDSVNIAYLFPNNLSEIKSLVLDNANNFYGIARKGNGSYRVNYLFKVNNTFDSTQIVHTWARSSGLFFETDIISVGNTVYGLYHDGSAKLFKYDTQLSNMYTRSLSSLGSLLKGPLVKGASNLYYGIIDNKIFSYNSSNNSIATVVNIGSSFSIAGNTPRTLSYKNGILYGINAVGPINNQSPAIFSYDLNATSNQLKLIHEFDSIEGRLGYYQRGSNPIIIDVCRPSEQANLIASLDTICPQGQSIIYVDSSELNSGTMWALYSDTLQSSLQQNSTGSFTVSPTTTTTYFVRGEGSCFSSAPFQSISIVVDSLKSFINIDSVSICKGSSFIRPFGDTIYNVQSNFIDTSVISTVYSACDSTIYTHVNVTALNLGIVRNNFQLTALANNVNYQWYNCSNQQAINGANSKQFIVSNNGAYGVIIDDGNCIDTSTCITIFSPLLSEEISALNGNNSSYLYHQIITNLDQDKLEFANSIKVFPNPTSGQFNLQLNQKYQELLISIKNIHGQLIQEKNYFNQNELLLNIESESGIYFITITNEHGEQSNLKIVKK